MKLDFITPQEAETIKRKMPKSKVMEEYEGYLKQLPEGQVGKLVVDRKDTIKPNTVKARLIRASRNLKLKIETKRVGNTVLFWTEKRDSELEDFIVEGKTKISNKSEKQG